MTKRKGSAKDPGKLFFWEIQENTLELNEQLTYSFKNQPFLVWGKMDSLTQWDGRDELCCVAASSPPSSLCPLSFRLCCLSKLFGSATGRRGASTSSSTFTCLLSPTYSGSSFSLRSRPRTHTHKKSILGERGSEGRCLQSCLTCKGGQL